MSIRTQIGWYTVKEDHEGVNEDFETACFYENVMVHAGRYPITIPDMRVFDNGCIESNFAYVACDATTISDYFPSLFCGTPIGHYDETQNAGRKSWYRITLRLYNLARMILDGCEDFELLPEYEAREIKFVSSYDGKECTTTEIFLKGARQ